MGCWWIAANGTWIAAIHDSEGGETCVNILQYQVHLTRHWNYKPPTTTINRWNNPISIVCAPSPIRQFDQTVATFENCTLSKFNFSMLKKCPHHVGKVPQHFATQFERPFAQVAHVYNAWLPYVFFGCDPSHIFFWPLEKVPSVQGSWLPRPKWKWKSRPRTTTSRHRPQYLLRFRKTSNQLW